jgi:tRNA A37 threonylcarbamoyladenosine dehydratase
MSKLNILLAGCGFLCTHLLFHLIPHSNHLVLLDRDKIEKENYDNSIFPKNYVGKTKVIALSSLVQLISSLQTTPIHQDVKSSEQLADICFNYDIGFIFATFDNIKSRLIVREVALSLGIPTIFIGVTEGYVDIDWADKIVLPET